MGPIADDGVKELICRMLLKETKEQLAPLQTFWEDPRQHNISLKNIFVNAGLIKNIKSSVQNSALFASEENLDA